VTERLVELLPYVAAGLAAAVSVVTSAHAILYKRDPRAAVSWAGVIWMAPVVGAFLYAVFGINRIRRRASRLRQRRMRMEPGLSPEACTPEELCRILGADHVNLAPLQRVGDEVLGRPLVEGNRVSPLVNGEEAYPEMLRAIDQAERSVALLAYIFEKDPVGESFIEALGRAAGRGVRVHVLIDDVGGGSALRFTERALRASGVRLERFLPLRLPRFGYANLRNHRKVLVADGRVGFTGGMNIRQSHLLGKPQRHHEQDVHFRIEGPVVEHLQQAFVDDWAFMTGEVLRGAEWFPALEPRGPVVARGIPFDPGEQHDRLRWMIVGALTCARTSVGIVTPYFLPDAAVVAALNVAALRGVQVDILLPGKNDNPLVHWASTAMLWQILQSGCRVWRTPPPFDHAKLMVVDGVWTLLGSANLDPRSLRLNFEFNVECYDPGLAGAVGRLVEARRAAARAVTLQEVDGRPLPIRLRDGVARLFTPYL
jgi:cardiolipin synthase